LLDKIHPEIDCKPSVGFNKMQSRRCPQKEPKIVTEKSNAVGYAAWNADWQNFADPDAWAFSHASLYTAGCTEENIQEIRILITGVKAAWDSERSSLSSATPKKQKTTSSPTSAPSFSLMPAPSEPSAMYSATDLYMHANAFDAWWHKIETSMFVPTPPDATFEGTVVLDGLRDPFE
jgi:hypothetical protein